MSDTYWLEIGGVPCNIFTGADGQSGHLTESNGDDGPRATVRFICDWDARNDLKAGLLGRVDYQDGAVVRTPPFFYPVGENDRSEFEDGSHGMFANRIFCTAVGQVEGIKWARDEEGEVTGLAGWGYFTYAVLTAEFTSPPYLVEALNPAAEGTSFGDLAGQLYCKTALKVSGEVFAPPEGSYRWTEGNRNGQVIRDANVGLLRPRYELSVTRVRMPIVPCQTLDNTIGTVNETTIKVGANTVSPEAALFMGYNVEEKPDPYHGGIVYDIEMLWAINGFISERNADGSWNWFVDPAGDWSSIGHPNQQDSFDPPFASAEHNDLFADEIA